LLLWSQRFDAATDEDSLLKLHDAVAAALLSRIAPRASIVAVISGRKRSISSIRKLLRQSHCSKQGTVASITCYLSVYRPRSSPETSLFYLGFPEGSMHGKVMALLTVIQPPPHFRGIASSASIEMGLLEQKSYLTNFWFSSCSYEWLALKIP
jgi:hypothetical protein